MNNLAISGDTLMTQVEKFLEIANKTFGIDNETGRGSSNPFYIHVPAKVSKGFLAAIPKSTGKAILTNPLIFLGNIRDPLVSPYAGQYTVGAPSISIIVGQYGFGKTELIHQICDFLKNRHSDHQGLFTLPINLAFCRSKLGVLNRNIKPSVEDFSDLLFGHLLNQAEFDKNFVFEDLLPIIKHGNILLILDGLDELLSNTTQHQTFFAALTNFLCNNEKIKYGGFRFKVIVCARLEYLRAVDNSEATELVKIINRENSSKIPVSIYFLNLDALDDSRINSYIDSTISDDKLFEKIKKNSKLLDILRRPLLLRIFCDLVKNRQNFELDNLLKVEQAGELLEIFTERASKDVDLSHAQERIAAFTWNLDNLARKSLEFYQDGKAEMNIDDIKSFIEPIGGNFGKFDDDEVLNSVHKCPFLQRFSDYSVRFAHRSFLEFFTAKGVAIALKEKNRKPFDELVLNVDTRKFLKYLVNKLFNSQDKFDELTRGSYGLQSEHEWELKTNLSFDELENIRKILLLSMTEPENPPADTEKLIRRFLKIEDDGLHPRFLLYCYESVAVYLRDHQWDEKVRGINQDFHNLSKLRLENTLSRLDLQEIPSYLKTPLKLLVERILDIGQRLRYRWVKEYLNEDKQRYLIEAFNADEEKETLDRIRMVLRHIENSIF
ncbi:MAG: NACHT domain-containing protein [Dendronalium sp. ChiSLP03b]